MSKYEIKQKLAISILDKYYKIDKLADGDLSRMTEAIKDALEYADQQTQLLTEQMQSLKDLNNELQDKLVNTENILREQLDLKDAAYSDLGNKYSKAFEQLAEKEKELSDLKVLLNTDSVYQALRYCCKNPTKTCMDDINDKGYIELYNFILKMNNRANP